MKITICAYDTPGNVDGPTAWIKRLLPYLRLNGIEVRILFFATNQKGLAAYNYFIQLGFQCKIIRWELFYEEKVTAILDDVKNNPPDIFIANYFPFALSASRWIKPAGIPVIMVLHNDDDFHYALIEEFGTKNEFGLSAIVGVSKLITGMLHKKNISPDKIYAIPCGAPVPQRTATNPAGRNIGLIYAGRIIEKQKRILSVTHAFCRVAKEIQGTTCNIYGSGLSEPDMQKILDTEGKGLPVAFGGKLDSNVVQEHLLQNHIFVLLSDYEGIPISLMEAMGCGLVPVCSNIRSGITELIENGKTGILVDDRNDTFVEAIKMLKENPEKWQSMSTAAREKIVNEYSEEICNKKWLGLLRQLHKNNSQKKSLMIPSVKEIKKYKIVRREFKGYYESKPFILFIPLHKAKALLGKLKRNLFK